LLHRKRQIPTDFVRIKETAHTDLTNEHLDQDRLERLAKALVDEALGQAPDSRPRELAGDRAHADYCPGCKASVETLVAAEMRFRKMMSSVEATTGVKTRECPPDRIWASVATGLISDQEAAPWIAHASECAFCGALLREATEDLAMDATPEELKQMQELVSPEWRRKMARVMSQAASGATPAPDASPAGLATDEHR
jgi:hypothetical protein